ncbi:molecular chaperone Skp [Sporomusa sp.]|uniref:molecular chaperone Skp n=1 Tax=Sporomusa sp. TaxID=2078658 RepID=UPI002D06B542|nr:molecular chaperone Skp [Sporomusa sp.]HWR44339.1 molecular chaperone Skp [Sporomusa sp.]
MKLTTPIRFLATLILGAVLLTGCARSIPETKSPEAPQVGVIDMDKAIKAHPKHQEWQKLKEQAATLNQQLAAEAGRTAGVTPQLPAMNLPGSAESGLRAAAEQEFNAKMAAKQQELQTRLADKANKIHGELSSTLKTYAEQLDKEYQPQLFNLQLKLQTVRMDEKESAEVKKALDGVKAEQANKLAVREKELVQKMDAALTPDKAAIEQELAAYAKELNSEISNKMAAQTANMAGQSAQSTIPPATSASVSALEQQFTRKQQEISAIEEYILNDIRDKAAKVATERSLDVVLTGQRVNVSAVDITDAVIAAIKK